MSSYTKTVLLEKLSSQQLTENENVELDCAPKVGQIFVRV